MYPKNENAPELGDNRGDANLVERANIISIRNSQDNQSFIGSLPWRRASGLLTLSDLAEAYESIREPRGPYFVSLQEDLR